jgi:hypothetical protein
MTTTKTWNNLTTHLQGFLSDHLDKDDVSSVMESWAEQKSAVSKLVGNSSSSSTKKKDPNAPKKGSSAYLMFCNEVRDSIKKENPDLKATEITKKMGAMWLELKEKAGKDDKKAKKQMESYVKKASDDKVRYEDQMKTYVPPEGTDAEEKTTRKSKKTKKDNTGPKKPISAYFFYCRDVRPQLKEDHPELKGTDVTKKMGEMWRGLSEDEKSLFADLAEKDKERYATECAQAGIELKPGKSKKEPKEKTEKPKEKKAEKPKEKTEKPKAEKAAPKKKKETPVVVVEDVVSDSETSSEEEVEEKVEEVKKKRQPAKTRR